MGFIYKVTNTVNNKVYIGKTNETVEARWKEHILDSRKPSLHRPFYDAIKKYGIENFFVETIEEVDNSLLEEREQFWIREYNSYVGFPNSNGYNGTLGGEGTRHYDYQAIIDDYMQTKSKTQTAKNFGCSVETINNACISSHVDTLNHNAGRKIQQIDISTGQVIKEFASIKQAAETIVGSNPQTVRKRITYIMNHAPNQKAYGYYWRLI